MRRGVQGNAVYVYDRVPGLEVFQSELRTIIYCFEMGGDNLGSELPGTVPLECVLDLLTLCTVQNKSEFLFFII